MGMTCPSRDWAVYKKKGDHLTDRDNVVLSWNDKCISLDKLHINTENISLCVTEVTDTAS